MRLQSGNSILPIFNVSFKESIWQFFSTLYFSTDKYLENKEYTLLQDDGTKIELVIVRKQYNKSVYIYTAMSAKTQKVLNSVTNTVNGFYTVKTLLNQKLGFRCSIINDSTSTYWLLPKTRFKNVIGKLNKYTSFGNGGGCHFYLDLDGYVNCVDLKLAYDHGVINQLSVTSIDSDICVEDWVLNTQGVVDVYSYGVNDNKITVNVEKDYGKASMRFVDSTGYFTALNKQKIHNDFYNAYFTSRSVKTSISVPTKPVLGTVYKLQDMDTKFILTEYEFEYPNQEGSVSTFNLNLSTCPK